MHQLFRCRRFGPRPCWRAQRCRGVARRGVRFINSLAQEVSLVPQGYRLLADLSSVCENVEATHGKPCDVCAYGFVARRRLVQGTFLDDTQ